MKTKTLAAVLMAATSITLISCDWLFHKKPSAENANSIVGKWKLGNIDDSSKNEKNANNLFAHALSTKDSLPIIVEFKPDSTYDFFQNNEPLEDSGKYYVDSLVQTLFMKKDSSADDFTFPLVIKNQTNSSLQLFSNKDSVWYKLSKQ